MTIDDLTAKRDNLLGQIGDAIVRLQKGDKSIEYARIKEMQDALLIIDNEIGRINAGTAVGTSSGIIRFSTSSGFGTNNGGLGS